MDSDTGIKCLERHSSTTTVETLMGAGKEGTNDGTGGTCTFA